MFSLLAMAAPAVSALSLAQDFDTPLLLHVETNQLISGLADMNGDGIADLVSHSYELPAFAQYETKVLVQLGLGDGRFAKTATASSFPVMESVVSTEPIVLGDFNGDGAVDAAFAQAGTVAQPFYYLLGNGDGTLQAPVADLDMFRRDNPPVAIQWDSDPQTEVAWVRRVPIEGQIHLVPEILEWNGAGFTTITTAPVSLPQPDAASIRSKLTVDDINGDGVGELIFVDRQNQIVRIYTNASGSLAQIAAVNLTAEADPNGGPLPLGDTGAVSGDFDGDGDVDVVTYHLRRVGFGFPEDPMALLTTWIENQEPGPFVIHPPVDLTFDDQDLSSTNLVADFRAVDWDQDGDDDLVGPIGPLGAFPFSLSFGSSSNSFATEVHFFENDGGAQFAVPGRRVNPGSVALAGVLDVDGDGSEDLVTHARVITSDGEFGDGPQFGQLPSIGFVPGVGDIDHDGDTDSVQLNGSLFTDFGGTSLNDGTGAFTVVANSSVDGIGPNTYISRAAFGDFDLDGQLEVAGVLVSFTDPFLGTFFDSGLALLELGEGGSWNLSNEQILSDYPDTDAPLVFDVDGDGSPDLVDGERHFPNDGSGSFGPPEFKFAGQSVVASADVDEDGDLDFITLESVLGIDTVRLRITEPVTDLEIELGLQSTAVLSPFSTILPSGQQKFIDADGDGDLDVITTLSQTPSEGSRFAILENLGSGFAPVQTYELPSSNESFEDLAVADTNDDDILDLAILTRSTIGFSGIWATLFVYHGNPGGLSYALPEQYLVTNNFALLDGDSDGDLDVLGSFGLTLGLANTQGGTIRQYGDGLPGADGLSPILGGTGPLSVGSTGASARIARGVGAAPGWLAVGSSQAELPNAPLLGLTLYIDGLNDLLPITLGGTPGVAGEGELVLPIPIALELAGAQIYAECFLVDVTSPSLLTHTNGLELTFAP